MNFGKLMSGIGIGIASMVGASIIDKGLHRIVDPRFDNTDELNADGATAPERSGMSEVQVESDLVSAVDELGEGLSE